MIKFQAILDIELALAAVQRNGYSLQYVLCKELFISIAKKLNIEIDIS